jgi:hypothetical protein
VVSSNNGTTIVLLFYCSRLLLLSEQSKYSFNSMSPIRNSTHRIQRYFSPLVVRTVFKPELLLTPPPMIWTTKFPYEEYGIIPDSETQNMQMQNGSDRSSHALIPKPKGDVTRISRQGYNLCDALAWQSELYNEIQVSPFPEASRSWRWPFIVDRAARPSCWAFGPHEDLD